MSVRLLVRGLIGLAVVLVAAFSTMRARQVLAERGAMASAQAARVDLGAALHRAKDAGLLPADRTPIRDQMHEIARWTAPEGNAVWNANGTAFYQRQERAYRALLPAIAAAFRLEISAARKEGMADATTLQSQIEATRRLDLEPGPTETLLAREKAVVSAPHTSLRSLRSADAALKAANVQLLGRSMQRAKAVTALLGAHHNDLTDMLKAVDDATQKSHDELGLLILTVPKDAALLKPVDTLHDAAHAQHDPYLAAVKLLELQGATAAAHAALVKDLPAKVIVISTENQDVQMYENGAPVYSSVVTTGGPELPTYHGIFHIYDKISPFTFHSPFPEGSPYWYPPSPVSYWMPFDDQQGLHDAPWRTNFGPGSDFAPTDLGTGTYILGTHGCVNLPPATAQFIWDWAPVGTMVVVD